MTPTQLANDDVPSVAKGITNGHRMVASFDIILPILFIFGHYAPTATRRTLIDRHIFRGWNGRRLMVAVDVWLSRVGVEEDSMVMGWMRRMVSFGYRVHLYTFSYLSIDGY
jgi:hypothetical protein